MREKNITTKSTKDTKGNQIEKKLRDLRVLRGRQILPHVTVADGLAGQVPLPQLSFGVESVYLEADKQRPIGTR